MKDKNTGKITKMTKEAAAVVVVEKTLEVGCKVAGKIGEAAMEMGKRDHERACKRVDSGLPISDKDLHAQSVILDRVKESTQKWNEKKEMEKKEMGDSSKTPHDHSSGSSKASHDKDCVVSCIKEINYNNQFLQQHSIEQILCVYQSGGINAVNLALEPDFLDLSGNYSLFLDEQK